MNGTQKEMKTTSRKDILARLDKTRLEPTPLPDLQGDWITFADPVQQFCSVLEAVGGKAVTARDEQHAVQLLEEIPSYRQAGRVCSRVPGVDKANVDLDQIQDPHRLEDVDYLITRGQFGVAENAAIWVTDQQVRQRAFYFIVQHLAVLLPVDQMVHNLHQAYERLTFASPGFGMFLSGPSKTADIEQSLVIGAHGARSMTVFLVGC